MRGRKSGKSRRGVTLVEVMLAGALLALAVISLFEGIGVAARIARENAQVLQADAYAHDLAWKRFNESYSALNSLVLSRNGNPIAENVASNAAPARWKPDRSVSAVGWRCWVIGCIREMRCSIKENRCVRRKSIS